MRGQQAEAASSKLVLDGSGVRSVDLEQRLSVYHDAGCRDGDVSVATSRAADIPAKWDAVHRMPHNHWTRDTDAVFTYTGIM
jgi:hypothetical protein